MINNTQSRKNNSGFTLIEMIVTMSIVAILASIAAPNFRSLLENNRVDAGASDFVSGLLLARSEALKRRNNVSICTSTNQTTCDGSELDFAKGWIVFQDCNSDGVVDPAIDCGNTTGSPPVPSMEAETVIKAQLGTKQLSIKQVAGAVAGEEGFFTYSVAGRVIGLTRSFNITRENTTTPILKEVTIVRTGRVKTCRGACP